MPRFEPWSKKHKHVTRAAHGGTPYNLSNSFAEPLTNSYLMDLARKRGDEALIDEYTNHSLEYTPNGGSLDLREEIARRYGERITAEHILVFGLSLNV